MDNFEFNRFYEFLFGFLLILLGTRAWFNCSLFFVLCRQLLEVGSYSQDTIFFHQEHNRLLTGYSTEIKGEILG